MSNIIKSVEDDIALNTILDSIASDLEDEYHSRQYAQECNIKALSDALLYALDTTYLTDPHPSKYKKLPKPLEDAMYASLALREALMIFKEKCSILLETDIKEKSNE